MTIASHGCVLLSWGDFAIYNAQNSTLQKYIFDPKCQQCQFQEPYSIIMSSSLSEQDKIEGGGGGGRVFLEYCVRGLGSVTTPYIPYLYIPYLYTLLTS